MYSCEWLKYLKNSETNNYTNGEKYYYKIYLKSNI